MTRLVEAIDRLIAFLDQGRKPDKDENYWTLHLRQIRTDLFDPALRPSALKKLGHSFGGMGSLNDYTFDPLNNNVPSGQDADDLNRELDRLLDRCYMEYRLWDKSRWARLRWRLMAVTHPRVKPRTLNAFAQE